MMIDAPRRCANWTAEEDAVVFLCYVCTDTDVLARHLGRTTNGVRWRSCEIGAPRRGNGTRAPSANRFQKMLEVECGALGLQFGPAASIDQRKPFVRARWRVFAKLRDMGFSLPGIGKAAGGKHHTTIMWALQRHKSAEERAS